MRTLDPTLASSLASLHFLAYFKLKVYRNGLLLSTLDVLKYKLTGTHLSVTVRGLIAVSNAPESIKIVLVRGIVENGVPHVLETSKFTPTTGTVTRVASKSLFVSTEVEAELIPPRAVGPIISGGHTYRMVITDFCTAIGKTAVFKNTTAPFWDYQFHPNDALLSLNNARQFLPMLWQKYLIFCCDNGSEQILFYNALDIPAGAFDYSINPVVYNLGTGYFGRRRFYATDENGAVRFAGSPGDTLFNLGFIRSIDLLPSIFEQAQPVSFDQPINLVCQNGDYIGVDGNSYSLYPLAVTEVFDPNLNPGWMVHLEQFIYFTNTEGGPLPQDLAVAISYVALDTSTFNGILNGNANNIQAAMNMLDDHQHKQSDIFGSHALLAAVPANSTYYMTPFTSGVNSTELAMGYPKASTLKYFSFRIGSAQPASGSLIITVRCDGVDTPLVINIPAGSPGGVTYTDWVHTFAAPAGVKVNIKIINNATAPSATIGFWSVQFESPTVM